MKKLDVVKSRTAPLRDSLWIKDNRLKTIGPNGWEDIESKNPFPSNGEDGQVLTKQGDSVAWEDLTLSLSYVNSYNTRINKNTITSSGYYLSLFNSNFIIDDTPIIGEFSILNKTFDNTINKFTYSIFPVMGDVNNIQKGEIYYILVDSSKFYKSTILFKGSDIYFANSAIDPLYTITIYDSAIVGNNSLIKDAINFELVELEITSVSGNRVSLNSASGISIYDTLKFPNNTNSVIVTNIEDNTIILDKNLVNISAGNIYVRRYYTYGNNSTLLGEGLKSFSPYQLVLGKYNKPSLNKNYLQVIGYGSSDKSRDNIETVDVNGVLWTKSDIYCGGNDDNPTHKLSEKLNNPAGGTEGQVLTKTSSGVAWTNPSSGGANVSVSGTTLIIS